MTTTAVQRFDRRLIPPMILGTILNPINSSIIAVALVPIGVALGASTSATAWLVSSLYLATSVGQPLVGRLVDTFGPRRLYLIGTTMAGIAGVLGALAPNLGVLVVARWSSASAPAPATPRPCISSAAKPSAPDRTARPAS